MLEDMTVAQLKEALTKLGETPKGTKADLIAQLTSLYS